MNLFAKLPPLACILLGAACTGPSNNPSDSIPPVVGPGEPTPMASEHLENVRALTSAGDNAEAYFDAEGKQLIFQRRGPDRQCDWIYTMGLDGTRRKLISSEGGACTCAYFLHDPSAVIYASTMSAGPGCPTRPKPSRKGQYLWPIFASYEIYRRDLASGALVNLTQNPGYDAEGTVGPDGRIVFTSHRAGDIDIYTMNPDGTDLRRLTFAFGYDGGPFFSPDGTHIIFRAWHPTTEEEQQRYASQLAAGYIEAVPLDLYIMDSSGHDMKRLTRSRGEVNWAPSWHPDGRRIIFSSNRDDFREEIQTYGPNFELYLLDLDSGGITRLTNNATFDSFPIFSPDGATLIFASNRDAKNPHSTNIYRADFVE